MPVKTTHVKLNIQTQELADTVAGTIKGSDGFSVVSGQNNTAPDLFIHELSENWEKDLERIRSYIETSENTDVFIVSETSDPQVLIQALRVGVKEFLPAPLQAAAVEEALARFKERQEKKNQKTSGFLGKIISVIGSKGGIGTTTIAVNLADILARKSENPSVVIIDMNMVFGDIPMFLDISPKHHWGDITKNIERLDEFFLANVLTKKTDSLHVLPSPRFLDSQPAPTSRMMETLLTVMTKKYDYIVIDLGQSINDAAFKVIQLSNLVQIITVQTLPCLSNANRLIRSLLDRRYTSQANLGVILNRYVKKGMVTLETAEEGLGQKIAWVIPNDFDVTMSAINAGQTLSDIAPKSKIVKSFTEYAETLIPEERKKKKDGFFKW